MLKTRYEITSISESELDKLHKAMVKARSTRRSYGTYRHWLHYTNLSNWQQQRYHFAYINLSFSDEKSCTCGLVATISPSGDSDLLMTPKVLQLIEGIDLDYIQQVKGHLQLPGLVEKSVAIIVKHHWREDLDCYIWDAICQECGQCIRALDSNQANAFVDTHNLECGE